MKLSVKERIDVLSILPREGNFINLKLVRKIREDLSFNETENKALKFKYLDDGRVTWDRKVAKKTIKDVEIGATVMEIIRKKLTQLSKAEKLSDEHIDLYAKFVGED